MHTYKLVFETTTIEYIPDRKGIAIVVDGKETFHTLAEIIGETNKDHDDAVAAAFLRINGQFTATSMGITPADVLERYLAAELALAGLGDKLVAAGELPENTAVNTKRTDLN